MKQDKAINITITGIVDDKCRQSSKVALDLIEKKLPIRVKQILGGSEIIIANGLINGGGLTNAEEKKIFLDADKNRLSLEEAEDILVATGYLHEGDWRSALPTIKNEAWSCLVYQLVHEFGHLVDGLCGGQTYKRLSVATSPTKYGQLNEAEAFAEAFAYWIFDLKMSSRAKQVVELVLENAAN